MRTRKINLNILAPFQIVVSIILGATGLVSWWVIGLIWFMSASIDVEI